MIKRQSLSPAAAKRIEEGREAVREGGGGGGTFLPLVFAVVIIIGIPSTML